jgi:hypothetical protein
MVPGEGVEPSLPKKPDFESGASTNSAIRAIKNIEETSYLGDVNINLEN